MPDHPVQDLYALRPEDVRDPPKTFLDMFRLIGPGLIIASGVVGSGELVMTTVLGAENGYALLWLILVSCAIKVVVHNEMGRYTVGTGETALEALNRIPGPRWRVSWVVWLWFVMLLTIMFPVGGMLGAIAEVLNTLFPALSINAGVWLVGSLTVILLLVGRYNLIEKVSMGLVVTFTALTVSCAFLLLETSEYFSWASMADGLFFHMPQGGLVTAVAVFGATGVGATELIYYPYWCIEKGYARFAGRPDDTVAWRSRARGWIGVMGVDVVNSMVIYTFATIAFYLLGAGVLHGMGLVPEGTETVQMLSAMYTETLGSWSRYLFLAGAVAVLYSTVFAATASHGRMLADFTGMLGLYDRHNYPARLKITRIAVVIILFVPALTFMYVREPVVMVKIGGVSQALMLPILGFSILYLRYVHLPKAVLPKGWITLALWIASVIMALMMGYSVIQQVATWSGGGGAH